MLPTLIALLLAPPGGSLEDEWATTWRRLQDRHGRPDPDGPQLQWAGDPQYLEYPFDQRQAGFPIGGERAWAEAAEGARFYVQSISEFTLTNVAQVKSRWPVGARWSVGLDYHQLQDRRTQSRLLQFVVRGDALGGGPLFVEGRLSPRWHKTDADAEAMVGARGAPGEVRLRLFALDPFVDPAYSLAESRDAELDEHLDQRGPPLGLALEALSARLGGVRGELFLGLVLPNTTAHRFPDRPDDDLTHRREAWLTGATLEWAHDPVIVGASLHHVAAVDAWREARVTTVREARTRARLYALAALPGGVRLEGAAHLEAADHEQTGEPARRLGERRRLWSLRAWWRPGAVVGAELGLLRAERDPSGDPPPWVDADAAHRLTTRCTLRLGAHLWLALGTGWDLDPGDGVYDGSGLTVIFTE